jgi:hypothetical protein
MNFHGPCVESFCPIVAGGTDQVAETRRQPVSAAMAVSNPEITST